MEPVIKIVEIVVPLLVELVKAMHPDKNDQEHKEIMNLVADHLKNKVNCAVN